METGREICGETTGWNEKVQQVISEKKKSYKNWQHNGEEIDREAYNQKRKKTKVVMASRKAEEYIIWERNKGKPKMKTELLKISKQKKMDRKDITGGKYVKDKKGDLKVNDNKIMDRWK